MRESKLEEKQAKDLWQTLQALAAPALPLLIRIGRSRARQFLDSHCRRETSPKVVRRFHQSGPNAQDVQPHIAPLCPSICKRERKAAAHPHSKSASAHDERCP